MFILRFCLFKNIFSFSHLLGKKFRFITTTIIRFSFYNFREFLGFRIYFFVYILIFCPAIMTSSQTIALIWFQLSEQNLFISWRSRGFNFSICFLSRFQKNKFNFYINIHNIFANNLFSLIFCSGEIESLLITSPKTSSTLNSVEFIISFLLSR